MREKVHKIHSLPEDSPWDKPVPPVGSTEHPLSVRSLDRVMTVQRPLVVAHIRSIRLRNRTIAVLRIVVPVIGVGALALMLGQIYLAGLARFLAAHTPTRRELSRVVDIATRLRRGEDLFGAE